MSIFNDIFGIGEGFVAGTEIKKVKIVMKSGEIMDGIKAINPIYGGVQINFTGGHPYSDAYVNMDLVDRIEEEK